MDILGETRLFRILGDPVYGVVSPLTINAWLRGHDIDPIMEPLKILAQGIGAFSDPLRTSEIF